MSLAGWLNTAWMLKCAGEARAFRRATRQVAATQAGLLAAMLRRNADTEFGRAHGFRRIRDGREYQDRVPLSRYEDYAGFVRRIAAGAKRVLTVEDVELLEPTSGTTAGEKWIPYTGSLRRQFQRAVAAWVADLYRQRPAVRRGRAYWSISPALGTPRHTPGGIPVGFEDDTAYLGGVERLVVQRLLVGSPALARLGNMETFRYCTLLCLLRADDLAFVSIWNPTFLTAVLAPLEAWADRLCFDVGHGTFQPPGPLPVALKRLLIARPAARRADVLQSVFRSRLSLPEKLRLAWPRLAVVSCWADAAAGRCLHQLRELFPHVEVQPKGLLATEGCVSFPLVGRTAPVLAVRSHFFEFQEINEADERAVCRLAHELDRGGRYRVILTTAGGLYRYQLRDEVEVAGFEDQCPLLRFLGKGDRVSDLVGEKLAEPHVRGVLDRLFAAHGLAPRFALLVPVEDRPPRYRLYLQAAGVSDESAAWRSFQLKLEAGLQENPYYRHAVSLGQLAGVEVERLDPGGESAWRVYERHCLERGQRAGNIKPAALDSWTGWAQAFRGLRRGRALVSSETAGQYP